MPKCSDRNLPVSCVRYMFNNPLYTSLLGNEAETNKMLQYSEQDSKQNVSPVPYRIRKVQFCTGIFFSFFYSLTFLFCYSVSFFSAVNFQMPIEKTALKVIKIRLFPSFYRINVCLTCCRWSAEPFSLLFVGVSPLPSSFIPTHFSIIISLLMCLIFCFLPPS